MTADGRAVGVGLRAGSGFFVGLVSGAFGGALAVAVSKNNSVLTAETNVRYLAVFGAYGAVLGALVLAVDAARRKSRSVIGWLCGGAILGGGVAGLGSLGLVRAIVQPVLDSSRDAENAFVAAFAIVFAALGLSIGAALGAVRGGRAALSSAIAGAGAGAIGGAAYVQIVLFADSIRTERTAENIAIATLAGIGAVIGFAIGAVSPAAANAPSSSPSTNGMAPAVTRVPWHYTPAPLPPFKADLPAPSIAVEPSAPIPEPAPPAPVPVAVVAPAIIVPPLAPAPVAVAEPVAEPVPVPAPVAVAAPAIVVPPPPVPVAEPAPPLPPPPLARAPSVSTAPVVAAPSGPEAPARFALRLDDGRSFAVQQRAIVGRDPQRVRQGDTDAVLVDADDGRAISANHFAIAWEDGRLFVEDLGSMSGSIIVSPAGVQTRVTNGTPMQVGDGWVVMFGTRRAHVLWL